MTASVMVPSAPTAAGASCWNSWASGGFWSAPSPLGEVMFEYQTRSEPAALAAFVASLLVGDASAPAVVGFAFAHDLRRLEPFLAGGEASPRRPVIDLQKRAGGTQSLRACCAAWLHRGLDKAQQCSDWCLRSIVIIRSNDGHPRAPYSSVVAGHGSGVAVSI